MADSTIRIVHQGAPVMAGMSSGASPTGAGSVPSPALNQMAQHLKQIRADSERMGGTMQRAMKQAGIKFNLAGILKQSQLFTGILGSVFQIGGAFVDIFLAAFMPILIPAIREIASWIPFFRRWIATPVGDAVNWLMKLADIMDKNLEDERTWLSEKLDFIPGIDKSLADHLASLLTVKNILIALGVTFFTRRFWVGLVKTIIPVIGGMITGPQGWATKLWKATGILAGGAGLWQTGARLDDARSGEVGPFDNDAANMAAILAGEGGPAVLAITKQNPMLAVLNQIMVGVNNMAGTTTNKAQNTPFTGFGSGGGVQGVDKYGIDIYINGVETPATMDTRTNVAETDARFGTNIGPEANPLRTAH